MVDQLTLGGEVAAPVQTQDGEALTFGWRIVRFAVWTLIGVLFLATLIASLWATLTLAQAMLDAITGLGTRL